MISRPHAQHDGRERADEPAPAHRHEQDHDGHDHAHGSRPRRWGQVGRLTERRRLLGALALTAVILIAEAIGGYVSGSRALLSDAGHMLSDVMAMSLSLFALAFAVRPADQRRTYGYYRLEILSALSNGVALLLLSAYLIYQAYGRLAELHAVRTSVMVPVAAVGLMANIGGLLMLSGSQSLNTRGAYLHVLSDTLSSVGVLVGGVLMRYTGWYRIDPIIAIAIAVLIVMSAIKLVKDAVDILLEAVPKALDLGKVRDVIEGIEGVCHVHDLHIWSITSGVYALSGHVAVEPGRISSVADNDGLLRQIKEKLIGQFHIEHSTLQLESEQYDHADDHSCAPQRTCTHQREIEDGSSATPNTATGSSLSRPAEEPA